MCLLIKGPAALMRSTLLNTPGLLEDIYHSNRDGLGVMYGTTSGVKARKCLPKTVEGARSFIQSFPADDRELACHWRMRTHGDIDFENCHPYKVEGGGWLMHNGILHTGNDGDRTKSDTWHYIREYLDSTMELVAHDSRFIKLLTDHIGSGNKFAMLTSDGRMSLAGEHRGLYVNGLWFSNTYAWSPEILDPALAPKPTKYTGLLNWKPKFSSGFSNGYGGYGSLVDRGLNDDEDEDELIYLDQQYGQDELELEATDWAELIGEGDVDEITQLLHADPTWIYSLLECFTSVAVNSKFTLAKRDQDVVDMLLKGDAKELVNYLREGHPQLVAECIVYYINWTPFELSQPELDTADNAAYAG